MEYLSEGKAIESVDFSCNCDKKGHSRVDWEANFMCGGGCNKKGWSKTRWGLYADQ